MRIKRPSPAMAVALLALFVALGGTSYATVSLVVPRNSVGTAQLRNDSVTRAKLAHGEITSVLIKKGSLMASDFAPGQIPAGPAGPTGPAGAKGDKGDKGDRGDTGATGAISQIAVRSNSVSVPPGGVGVVTVSADSDYRAAGAGTAWSLNHGDPGAGLSTISLTPSYDSSGVTGYTARGENKTANWRTFTVYALVYHR